MAGKAIGVLMVLLAVCGILPLSAISNRIPRVFDGVNLVIRLALPIAYLFTELWTPSLILKFISSTHNIVSILIRVTLVVFQLVVVLTMSRTFGRSLLPVSKMLLESPFVLIPGLVYTFLIVVYASIWRNPFTSLNRFPGISNYFGYIGCVLVVTLQTVLVEIFLQELRRLNRQLETSTKTHLDLEARLARVAQRRARLNILMSEVEAGVGPVVAASVFTLCLRLSFSLFTNFSMVAKMFSGDQPDAFLYLFYPRSILKMVALVGLAHAGQRLRDEANHGELLLNAIATTDRNFLPSTFNFQIQKCHLVFNKESMTISAWGFFNLDHTLITMMVGMIFGLVMIQVQFQVSEVISS